MRNKSCCNRAEQLQAINWKRRIARSAMLGATAILAVSLAAPRAATGGDAPAWMHALVSTPVPEHDEKIEAVLLYSEDVLTVKPDGKMKRLKRRAYKILRATGKDYGIVGATYDAETKISSMHGWCIPTQGKDYEVKDKEAVETALTGVENGELVTDIRTKFLKIPAAEPGNIVGYEVEQEERPFVYQDIWMFQQQVPVRETRFTLQLPPGWEYRATWLNYPEAKETASGNNQWHWEVSDVKAIKPEDEMPPWQGVAGQLLITFLPPGGSDKKGFETWNEIGKWEGNLEQGRRDSSPGIQQKVKELTAGKSSTADKMRALADFVQRDIRYVAIELGIGGLQPHPAKDIFEHHYGDCKDKATLMGSMLKEIGVESYYMSINTTRGATTAQTPPHPFWFNHEIIGIRLPDDVQDAEFVAIYQHPKLGRILIFDPTDELTPVGQLRGDLQANYGLLVTPDGGDLIELPQLSPAKNGVHRVGKFQLAANGGLAGDVTEMYVGDSATRQRYFFQSAQKDADRVKYLESLLSGSLSTYQITKAAVGNLNEKHLPIQYQYSLTAPNYAKTAGNLLLVRPRVLGHASSDLLEKKEPRKYAVEFAGPEMNVIKFDITLPAGYEVDELPPSVDVDYPFGSYHAKTVAEGNVIRYTRTFEIKQVSVPVNQTDDLKKFYRVIASDERNTAVLKPASAH
jgi:uncharacterized protein DUF3857/transglutaminase superfamily protein